MNATHTDKSNEPALPAQWPRTWTLEERLEAEARRAAYRSPAEIAGRWTTEEAALVDEANVVYVAAMAAQTQAQRALAAAVQARSRAEHPTETVLRSGAVVRATVARDTMAAAQRDERSAADALAEARFAAQTARRRCNRITADASEAAVARRQRVQGAASAAAFADRHRLGRVRSRIGTALSDAIGWSDEQ